MEEINGLIRGAAIGLFLLMATALARTWRRQPLAWIGSLCAAGAIAYLLQPGMTGWPVFLRLLLAILALSCPFFFWTLTRTIFDDGFALRPAHWALLAMIVIAGIAQAILPGIWLPWLPGSLGLGFRLTLLGLIVHAFWIVWSGWTADLVEKRVRIRLIFLATTGIVAALVVLAALLYGPPVRRPLPARLAEAVGFLTVGLGLALMLMRVDEDFFPPAKAIPPDGPVTANPTAIATTTDATTGDATTADVEAQRDADDLTRLDSLMRNQEAWRETGLTIGGLAARAGIPEYRLRRLINQNLGHRNFTTYINEYRLSAAAARLVDRDQLRVPVLTIALDLGWGSIGPFNRAFRARFGMTPTDYRRAKTAGPGLQTLADS
jgi:AraC-like DNA-binding protein